MPKGSQGTKRPNREDSSSSQKSKDSHHTACSGVSMPVIEHEEQPDTSAANGGIDDETSMCKAYLYVILSRTEQ